LRNHAPLGARPNYELSVDLEKCLVEDERGFSGSFAMDEFSPHCLLHGLEDIGLTLQQGRNHGLRG